MVKTMLWGSICMQKDVKTMKNKIDRGFAFVSRNFRYVGIALVLTTALIATGKPSEIIALLAPYRGDPIVLSSILGMMGVLSTLFGYALKR
jgi:hypothetical protein